MKTSNKKILPAFLLSFFIGVFGAHRFYVGKIGTAIVMLLLTLSFIGLIVSAIWNLIDWIMILVGKFEDKEGNTLTDWT
jgi:TM2 domain-containing membrane protein YozV